ncbi:MAG: DUF5916 domain-containing protein [Candidatus Rariloculaceae bacterium]
MDGHTLENAEKLNAVIYVSRKPGSCSLVPGLILVAMLFCVIPDAQAQDQMVRIDRTERKVADIVRVSEAPVIDGILDDAVWASATVIRDLHQYDPINQGVPTEESTFYIMYDDDNLYLGARLLDSQPEQIAARQMIQDQSVGLDDRLEFILDPFNTMRAGYKFMLNPNGVRRDGIFEKASSINSDWDGIWTAEAMIDDEGWTAELAIPFKSLNFDPENPDWGFTVGRAIPRKKERISWTSFDRTVNLSSTGVLSGFEDLRQGKGVSIIPSLIATGSRDYETSTDETTMEPSVDFFYNFTPSLTGVLTLNTDFSATEVDNRQVNLSRFSPFFPEKRDFFLQDVGIFSFGDLDRNGIPFFSRRIGLNSSGQPVDLEVGGKITGRSGRWNIGALGVQQAGFGDVDDSDLFVGRFSSNVFQESNVGIILTDGDPRSNLDNSVAGADFRYRNTRLPGGRTFESATWFQQSDTEGVDAKQTAWGASVSMPTTQGFYGDLEYEVIQENFNPALGFVNRSDYVRKRIGGGHRFRTTNHPWLRSNQIFIGRWSYEDEVTGELQSETTFFRPLRLINHRGDRYGLTMADQTEVLTDPFEISDGIIIAPGEYDLSNYRLEYELAGERTFAPRLTAQNGRFYGGDKLTLTGGIDWRPNSRIFLGASYQYNDVELPVGNFTTRLIRLNANFAFNVRWSWVNFLQYDNVSGTAALNSRLRYNPRAGEDLYIVWNHNSDAMATFSGLSSRAAEIGVKYTKTFRF